MKYDLLSQTPPEMPKRLPGFVAHAISKVPEVMRPAGAMGIFAPASALMHDVTFRHVDNKIHEPAFMVGCIAQSSMGKGYLDDLYEAIVRSLRAHDEENAKKLEEWSRIYNSKGGSKDKPQRPTDAAILVPEPDMTNAALIQLLMDAEREGNRSLYTCIPELDMLNQCCGGHKKVSNVIRVNFDTKRYGAQRATPSGISGNPHIRWKFNFACTPEVAQTFFKNNLTDGTLGRVFVAYVPRPAEKKKPIQGNYDKEYFDKLDEYLIRLRSAAGEVKTPELTKLITRIESDFSKEFEMVEDEDFEAFCHRAIVMAWLAGCVLFIAHAYRWTQTESDFVEWLLYYDLWSKISLFFPQLKTGKAKMIKPDNKMYGPRNMLDQLPISFNKEQLEKLRETAGLDPECMFQLTNWRQRGYVEYSAQTGLYTKTEEYLSKHPQF